MSGRNLGSGSGFLFGFGFWLPIELMKSFKLIVLPLSSARLSRIDGSDRPNRTVGVAPSASVSYHEASSRVARPKVKTEGSIPFKSERQGEQGEP